MKSIRLNSNLRDTIINRIMTAWDLANPCKVTEQSEWEVTKQELFVPAINEKLKRMPDYLAWVNLPETKKYLTSSPHSYHRNIKYPNGSTSNYNYLEDVKGILTPLLPADFCSGMLFDYSQETLPTWAEKAVTSWKRKIKGIKANNALYDEHVKERRLYRDEITNIIYNVNTTGQLLDVWPEVEKFLPETAVNPSKTTLPAVSTKKLNAALKA